jgi:Uncharacterized conserved protein (DUF2190)
MSDYTPATGATTVTMVAAAPVKASDPLKVAGSGTVRRVSAGGDITIGIAAHNCAAGQNLAVYVNGVVHEGRTSGPVTAGDALIAAFAADRQVIRYTPPTDPPGAADVRMIMSVVGIALTSAVDGGVCRWISR